MQDVASHQHSTLSVLLVAYCSNRPTLCGNVSIALRSTHTRLCLQSLAPPSGSCSNCCRAAPHLLAIGELLRVCTAAGSCRRCRQRLLLALTSFHDLHHPQLYLACLEVIWAADRCCCLAWSTCAKLEARVGCAVACASSQHTQISTSSLSWELLLVKLRHTWTCMAQHTM